MWKEIFHFRFYKCSTPLRNIATSIENWIIYVFQMGIQWNRPEMHSSKHKFKPTHQALKCFAGSLTNDKSVKDLIIVLKLLWTAGWYSWKNRSWKVFTDLGIVPPDWTDLRVHCNWWWKPVSPWPTWFKVKADHSSTGNPWTGKHQVLAITKANKYLILLFLICIITCTSSNIYTCILWEYVIM